MNRTTTAIDDVRARYRTRVGNGVTVLAYPAVGHEELMGWYAEHHALTFYLGVRVGDIAFESDRLRAQHWGPYTLLYRPPGADFVHNCIHAADIIEVHFDDSALAHLDGLTGRTFEPGLGRTAPQLAPLSKSLTALVYGPDGEDPLAVDSSAYEFLAGASEAFPGTPSTSSNCGRRLDPVRLARTLDCVEARLEQRLALADLAAEAGLNLHYFAKAFKATTGSTPHQHITSRRVSRARTLLEAEGEDIADIALACGFSSQSHLTEQFRRQVGVTPRRYREASRR